MQKLFYISLLFFVFACNDNEINLQENKKSINKDSFKVVIPYDSEGKVARYYSHLKDMERRLGLSSLESGVDSVQIRIWYGTAFIDELQLIDIMNEKNKWSAKIYLIKEVFDHNHDSIISIHKKITAKEPKSSWNNFTNTLISLNIFTLPDYEGIPDYQFCQDGDGITIEVATSKMYRVYNYPCLAIQHDSIWQAWDVKKILQLCEDELQFKRVSFVDTLQ